MADLDALDAVVSVSFCRIFLGEHIQGEAAVILCLIRIAGKAAVQIYNPVNNFGFSQVSAVIEMNQGIVALDLHLVHRGASAEGKYFGLWIIFDWYHS